MFMNYKMNAASLLLPKSPIRIFLVTYSNQKYIGNKVLENPVQPEQFDTLQSHHTISFHCHLLSGLT